MTNLGIRRLGAASVVAVLLWTGCSRSKEGARAGGPPPVPVQTAVAQQRDVPRVISAVGTIQPLRTVTVKSQVDGVIAEIHFREGDEVKAGDLLVTLDRRPFENALRIARAEVENAKAEAARAASDVQRYRQLDQQDAISKEQFNQLETRNATTHAVLHAKEAAVANAELQLSYTRIKAPISGRTGQLLLHEGALVKANDANTSLVTLNQLAPIYATFSVPENSLGAIRSAAGDVEKLSVTVTDRITGVSRSDGKLTFIDNTVDATTGTITLKAEFPNADHALWPGQFVQAELSVGIDQGATVVPSTAVQLGQSGPQIFVVKQDRSVELRPVRVLRTAGDNSLIEAGVAVGETVVTDGQLRLVPGARIEVKNLAPAPSGAKAAPASP